MRRLGTFPPVNLWVRRCCNKLGCCWEEWMAESEWKNLLTPSQRVSGSMGTRESEALREVRRPRRGSIRFCF